MGWADNYISKLKAGETIKFRPRGGLMKGKIESGQLVTVIPIVDNVLLEGMIVLCKVSGRQFLHLIKAEQGGRYQIGNNKGNINGWTGSDLWYRNQDRGLI